MTKKLKQIFFSGLAIIMVVSLAACGNTSQGDANGKMKITTTTTFLTDLVKQIGGEHVEVTGLMGAGVDPHQYQASSSDLTKLQDANLVFYGGLHLEAKLGEVLGKLGDRVVDTSRNIPKTELLYSEDLTEEEIAELSKDEASADEGLYDPHIWFDVNLWRIVAKDVTDTLKKNDADHATDYQKAYEDYMKELDELDTYVKTKLAEIPESSRYLVTAHDAFNYFARYADMEVRGIQGVSTNTEAGTNDVMETANFIVEHQIKAVFVESSVPPKLVQALQESVKSKGFNTEIGGELFSDATGDPGTEEGTYIGMYKHNINTMVEALK